MKDEYFPRIIDSQIKQLIDGIGAVVIEGPEGCGKTTTAEMFSNSKIELISESEIEKFRTYLSVDDRSILNKTAPLLIDEWQSVPEVWEIIRVEVDRRDETGQFIMTGSVDYSGDKISHSGAGRISKIRMRTMSLFESSKSTGEVSLSDLFNCIDYINAESKLSINDIAECIVRGGWPDSDDSVNNQKQLVSRIKSSVKRNYLMKNPKKKIDSSSVGKILKSISGNISQPVNISKLAKETGENMTDYLANRLIDSLSDIFMLENLEAWNPAMKTTVGVRTTPKWEFADPSIAAAFLKKDKDALLNDFNLLRTLFKSLCLRDLRIYLENQRAHVMHYRDEYNHEVDFILGLSGGSWAAVNVTMLLNEEEKAAKDLLRLVEKVDLEINGEPKFLMILTAGKYAYRRPDGIFVVPIGCLKD